MEEALSITASIASIAGGVVGLLSGQRRRAKEREKAHEEMLKAPEQAALATQVVALIALILAGASHLFARTALDREAYSPFDTFRAATYILAWIAVGGAVAAFVLPLLLQRKSTGMAYALFIIPTAAVLMMFTYLLRESRA